ncbi:MAG: BrnA antitoxin family protein [Allorhizobium sp.]
MKKTKPVADGFREGRGYTRADWDEVGDNPELTEAEIAELRPFREAFPDLAEAIDRKLGRPKAENPKKAISIRLDQEVIDRFKATGDGWQSRMNEALRKAVGL